MPKTVILGAARTPFGKLGGGLSTIDATDLGGTAISAALERAEVKPDEVQQVGFGQGRQAGQGQIPSRQAQIKAGIPKEVSSETVNKVCASGIRSAGMVDQAVRAGDLDVAVAGGMESMSKAPYLLKDARFGYRMGDAKAIDAMMHDGLTNPFTGKGMIAEATEVGEELELSRPDLDKFALRSHQLAVQATDEGRLPEEIVAVTVKSKKAETTVEVNVDGGAIALGHPIGASGARMLMTLANELRRRGGGLGVAAICSGGGQGDAVIIEVNGA